MKPQIGPFKLYTTQPNDIQFGYIYTMEVTLPLPYYQKRTVRIYLPEDFSFEKEYPMLVMSDGQNMVDKYTSAFGAWDIDVRQHELLIEGYRSFIVLGIDCPVGPIERAYEYSFPGLEIAHWETGSYKREKQLELYSHKLFKYIAEELIPLVRRYFPISKDKKDIAPIGSSMGGVYALALMTSYPEVFGGAICFSPAYFLYDEKQLIEYLDISTKNISKDHWIYFYVGNIGFENTFVEQTVNVYNYFKNNGYKNVDLLIDLEAEHNEYCWSKHFNEAIRFWMS